MTEPATATAPHDAAMAERSDELRLRMRWRGGGCGALAHALHLKTGWPIVGVSSLHPDDWDEDESDEYKLDHFGVQTPDGSFLDYAGADHMGGYPYSETVSEGWLARLFALDVIGHPDDYPDADAHADKVLGEYQRDLT